MVEWSRGWSLPQEELRSGKKIDPGKTGWDRITNTCCQSYSTATAGWVIIKEIRPSGVFQPGDLRNPTIRNSVSAGWQDATGWHWASVGKANLCLAYFIIHDWPIITSLMAALIKTSCLSEAGFYPFNMNKEALKNVEVFYSTMWWFACRLPRWCLANQPNSTKITTNTETAMLSNFYSPQIPHPA